MEANEPLVTEGFVRGMLQVEQIKEQSKGWFSRFILGMQLEYLHVRLGPDLKLRMGNFKRFQDDHSETRER